MGGITIGNHGRGEDYGKTLSVAYFLIMATFLILAGRLWYLQMIKGDYYRRFSEENRIELKKDYATRGILYDRSGRVIADNRPSFDLEIIRADLGRPAEAAMADLEQLLGSESFSAEQALKKIRAEYGPFKPVTVKSDLTPDDLALLEANSMRLPGVRITLRPVRKYLYNNLLAHLLGTMGEINKKELDAQPANAAVPYRQGDLIGKSGVEKEFEYWLRGRDGEWPVILDAHGKEIEEDPEETLHPLFAPKESVPGHDVHLTIDLPLQQYLETIFPYERGAVVALDPRNGEILAWMSRPGFDPSKFTRGVGVDYWRDLLNDPGKPLNDRTVQGLYPPGSTYKIIGSTAGLEEGRVTPGKTFFCPGFFHLGRETKQCWKKTPGHGAVDLHNAIKQSCDVYYYNIGYLLGVDVMAKYAKNYFGFGEKTGVKVNQEKSGLVPTEEWKKRVYGIPWVGGESLSVAIGQGYNLVTPLQLAVAYAVIANGGSLYQPQVVRKVENHQGQVIFTAQPKVRRQVTFKPETLQALRRGLYAVVNEPQGTAYWGGRSALVPIAGKTGTAQVISRIKIGVHETLLKDHAWFVAFAPWDQAQMVVVVLAENAGHGSSAAAPIAKKLIEFYLANQEAAPEKKAPPPAAEEEEVD